MPGHVKINVGSSGEISAANPLPVSGSFGAGDNNIGNVDIVSIAAGEMVIGLISTSDTVISLTPVCDTSVYAIGDVLFDTTALASVGRVSGGVVVLETVTVLDEDDQAAAQIDLYFLDANNSLGTFNIAPAITDANARSIVGQVSIESSLFKDLGASKFACKPAIGLMMQLNASTSLWVAAVTQGTPTQTASGLKLKFGFLR